MRLSENDIRFILTSNECGSLLAIKFDKTKQCISQVRLGLTHKTVAPEIPRWSTAASKTSESGPARSCLSCYYWRDGPDPCKQGMPDAINNGPEFAADCDLFERKNMEEEFDAMKTALEERRFYAELDIAPTGWIFGVKAYESILANYELVATMVQLNKSKDKNLFLGLPFTIDPLANPWTIKLVEPSIL